MEKRQVDVIVLSDLHLGTYGCKDREILSYLSSVHPQMLILNGDIIDIWQFSKYYFPPCHVLIIKEILELMASGTRVIYITGNHDELLRRYSSLKMGNLQLVDKVVLEIDNKMTWIFHGDVFDNTTKGAARLWAKLGSKGYAVLLFTNRLVNSFLRLIGKERISLSKRIMRHLNRSIIKIDEFETKIGEIAISKKYEYVICGHIHQPKKRRITNQFGSVMYLNSGDWVEHLTSLEYSNHEWKINYFDPKHNGIERIISKIPEPDMITDDISYYIHSLIDNKKEA